MKHSPHSSLEVSSPSSGSKGIHFCDKKSTRMSLVSSIVKAVALNLSLPKLPDGQQRCSAPLLPSLLLLSLLYFEVFMLYFERSHREFKSCSGRNSETSERHEMLLLQLVSAF